MGQRVGDGLQITITVIAEGGRPRIASRPCGDRGQSPTDVIREASRNNPKYLRLSHSALGVDGRRALSVVSR